MISEREAAFASLMVLSTGAYLVGLLRGGHGDLLIGADLTVARDRHFRPLVLADDWLPCLSLRLSTWQSAADLNSARHPASIRPPENFLSSEDKYEGAGRQGNGRITDCQTPSTFELVASHTAH